MVRSGHEGAVTSLNSFRVDRISIEGQNIACTMAEWLKRMRKSKKPCQKRSFLGVLTDRLENIKKVNRKNRFLTRDSLSNAKTDELLAIAD